MLDYGPREGLLDFLDVIWGQRGTHEVDNSGYVCVATISKDKTFKRSMFQWPDNSASIVTKIFKESAERNEVYVYPAMFKEPTNTQKANFKHSYTLWVDFDGNAPEHWDESTHGIVQPTMRIISSTIDRQHNYWKLDEPVTSVPELESRTRTLAYELNADIGGWDATQLLRPPYTTNYGYSKDGRNPHDVRVEELSERRYALTDFAVNDTLVAKSPIGLDAKLSPVNTMLAFNSWSEQLLDDWDHTPTESSKLRSDALVSMAHQACELGWSDEMIYSLVYHMDQKIRKYTTRSDAIKRYTDIVIRVRMKHPVLEEQVELGDSAYDTVDSIYVYEHFQKWIMEGIMPEQSLGLLVSAPGLGKTTVSLRLAMALAGGKDDFLGHSLDPAVKTKILYYSLEMAKVPLSAFLRTMNLSPDERAAVSSLIIAATGRDMLLDTPVGRQMFEDGIKLHQPTLIIIDSLNKILKGSINNDDSVRELTRYLTAICQDHSTSILLLHHDRKRGEQFSSQPTVLDDVYGSRFLTSECDYVITLNKVSDNKEAIRINYVKVRFAQEPEVRIIKRVGNLDFELVKDFESVRNANANPHSTTTRRSGPNSDEGFSGRVFGQNSD